jgi:hypothetical protein
MDENMRIAYFIIAHKNPQQLASLVNALKYQHTDIYIHIDKKSDIHPFKEALKHTEVFFIKKRVNIHWGAYSQIKATLICLEQILEEKKEYQHIIYLTGQDYPIKPNRYIHTYLQDNKGKEFINYSIVSDTLATSYGERLKGYYFQDVRPIFFQKVLRKLFSFLPKRTFDYLPIFAGSCYFIITEACAQYIVEFSKKEKQVMRHLAYSLCPDELFIQIIVLNSPFKNLVINDNKRYIEWDSGSSHPRNLMLQDFEKLQQTNMLFARKFDTGTDAAIIEKIDQLLLA